VKIAIMFLNANLYAVFFIRSTTIKNENKRTPIVKQNFSGPACKNKTPEDISEVSIYEIRVKY
jgi:hypothetical protein